VAVVGKRVLTLRDVEVDYVLTYLLEKRKTVAAGVVRVDIKTFDEARNALIQKTLVLNYLDNGGVLTKPSPEWLNQNQTEIRRVFTSEKERSEYFYSQGIGAKEMERFLADHSRSDQFMNENVAARVTVTDAEVRSFYEEHKQRRFLGKSFENVENLVRTQVQREKIKKEFQRWLETETRRTEIVLLPVDLPKG
jgi:hypothetical protein